MKILLTLLITFSIPTLIFSQEKNIISWGVGIPVIINPNHSPSDVYSNSGIEFLLEKQIVFLNVKSKHFSLTPGFDFIKFSEYYSTTGLGHWYEYDKYSKAVSIYSKLLMDFTLKSDQLLKFYGGAVSGVYLWSETKKIQYQKVQSQNNGKSFFNAAYFGFLLGAAPNFSNNFISPKLEFSFCPNFVTMNNQKRNAAKISVLVNFNLVDKSLK